MADKKQKLRLILQEKGGVGKSHLMYLLGVKYELDESVFFIDADSGNASTTTQLNFVSGRLGEATFLGEDKKPDRQLFMTNFLDYAAKINADTFIFDLGAPESQQFPLLITDELITPEDLNNFLNDNNLSLELDVVVSVGIAYGASIKYMNKIVELFKKIADIKVFVNRFEKDVQPQNYNQLIKIILPQYIENKEISSFHEYGFVSPRSVSGKYILANLANGLGNEAYQNNYLGKLYLSKELIDIV